MRVASLQAKKFNVTSDVLLRKNVSLRREGMESYLYV